MFAKMTSIVLVGFLLTFDVAAAAPTGIIQLKPAGINRLLADTFRNEQIYPDKTGAVLVRQNDRYLVAGVRQEVRMVLVSLADWQVKARFGRRGQGPEELETISDISIAGNRVYVMDGYRKKVLCYGMDGRLLKTYRLQGRGERFAVDARNRRFIISHCGNPCLFVADMDSGELQRTASLPPVANTFLDQRYLTSTYVLFDGSHTWLLKEFLPEVVRLDRRYRATTIPICPPSFMHVLNRLQAAIAASERGENPGMRDWCKGGVILDGNLIVNNLNYVTVLSVDGGEPVYYRLMTDDPNRPGKLLSQSYDIVVVTKDAFHAYDSDEELWRFFPRP